MSEKASSKMSTPCFYISYYLNCIRLYCKNVFKILYDFERKLGNKSHNFRYYFSVYFVIIYVSIESESVFTAIS